MLRRLRVHSAVKILIAILTIGIVTPTSSQEPLPYWKVVTDVLTTLDSVCWPVNDRGNIRFVFRDLDSNGLEDACVLCAGVESFEDAEYSLLSSARQQDIQYSLQVFYQKPGEMVQGTPIVFGGNRILETLDVIEISSRSELPFAVSTRFKTEDGALTEWVVFGKGGPSQISLLEDISNSLLIYDLDADDLLDVVLYDSGFEEGAGFETYLHWYRWNGRRYAREEDSNIVRNLNEFFDDCAVLLSSGNWEEFGSGCIVAEDYNRLPDEYRNGRTLLETVFTLEKPPAGANNPPVPDNAALSKVVFPAIFENPFTLEAGLPAEFPISVRFITSDGTGHLYRAKVLMNSNPFGNRQFSFHADSRR